MSSSYSAIGSRLLPCLLGLSCGCSSAAQVPPRMPSRAAASASALTSSAPLVLPAVNGSLASYVALAVDHSPRVRAAFESWRAASFAVGKSGRMPEPTINFGYFVRSIETRVGPQTYNLGITQAIPWLSKLGASERAASERARAQALVTDAEVLAVRRDVADAYWSLWLIGEEHRLRSEHDILLEALAAAVRARLQTGAASLADLNQVDLNIARHHDHRDGHQQARLRVQAQLLAAMGAEPVSEMLNVSDEPPIGMPVVADSELMTLARAHPLIDRLDHLARSEAEMASAEAADRYPRFMLGANLIGIGEASMPGVSGSGDDALVVSAGVSVPLWFSSYDDGEASARAASRAQRALGEQGQRQAEASVAASLSSLRDSYRRMQLYEKTLIPQAQVTFEAVLGGYQVKTSSVAAVILAQRDLIDLQLEDASARAAHAKGLAQLEYLVGRSLVLKGSADE